MLIYSLRLKTQYAATLQKNNKAKQLTEQQLFNIRSAFQSKEIEEHKYYLSEKRGFDVGLEQSTLDWIANGQAKRFAEDFEKNQKQIFAHCANNCSDQNCSNACELSIQDIHDLLGDT